MRNLKHALAILLCFGMLLCAGCSDAPKPGETAGTSELQYIVPGVWNEMPVFPGDHMSIIGGMTIKKDVRPFYLDLLQMIDALPQT